MQFGSNFVDILLWTLWIWLVFAFFMVMFRVFGDLFSDTSVSGMGKFWWSVFIIFLPFLGLLVYVIARGNGMAKRSMKAQSDAQQQFNDYVQTVASSQAPADQIASAKALLDAGTIDQGEFDRLKAKALG